MDHGHFDDLTRSVAGGGETRRAVLRLLAGGALGALTARLGLTEVAEAKQKRKGRPEPKRAVQAEGKRKRKKGGKKKQKPTPPCGADKYQCSDGSCIDPLDACCPGQKLCPGRVCIAADQCCPGEKSCGGGMCVSAGQCCPNPLFLCAECEEKVCENGEWDCRSACQHPDAVCCDNQCLAPCSGGRSLDPETCLCECPPDEGSCPPNSHRVPETCDGCVCDGAACGIGPYTWCCSYTHPICWWGGGTRLGCLTEDGGGHTCPPGWTVAPGSDPEHRHCWPPGA